MKFIVDNDIVVEQPTAEMSKWIESHLVLHNPDFEKKKRMGLWLGDTPRYIWLYEKDGNDYRVPFGCLQYLYNIAKDYEWILNIHEKRNVYYKSDITLYDYQKEAVEQALNKKNGVLVMPCGSGKTQCGLEIISRVGGRALWLTHTQDLLNQSKARAESVLEQGGYGTITAGKVDLGTHITFATVQTLSKLNLSKYKDLWDIIIVDECQHCCGSPVRVTQFYKVISSLSARYKIGLTATPHRADGLEKSMFTLLGQKIHEIDRDALENKVCEVRIKAYNTNYVPDYFAITEGDGTLKYSALVNDLCENVDRFNFVLSIISKIQDGESVLVLGSRISYLQKLCKAYIEVTGRKAICLSGMGNSQDAKKKRKNAIQALNNGRLDCIFASYKLAAEGLDCPNLRYVVLATPEKDKTIISQSAGRVGRQADGKEYGTVIDFYDKFGIYVDWAKKRAGIFRELYGSGAISTCF